MEHGQIKFTTKRRAFLVTWSYSRLQIKLHFEALKYIAIWGKCPLCKVKSSQNTNICESFVHSAIEEYLVRNNAKKKVNYKLQKNFKLYFSEHFVYLQLTLLLSFFNTHTHFSWVLTTSCSNFGVHPILINYYFLALIEHRLTCRSLAFSESATTS